MKKTEDRKGRIIKVEIISQDTSFPRRIRRDLYLNNGNGYRKNLIVVESVFCNNFQHYTSCEVTLKVLGIKSLKGCFGICVSP